MKRWRRLLMWCHNPTWTWQLVLGTICATHFVIWTWGTGHSYPGWVLAWKIVGFAFAATLALVGLRMIAKRRAELIEQGADATPRHVLRD